MARVIYPDFNKCDAANLISGFPHSKLYSKDPVSVSYEIQKQID